MTPKRTDRVAPRAPSGTRTILDAANPTVTLTRRQSAIGTLTIEAACSPAVGDLRLGCAFQLVSGTSSAVSHSDGIRVGPPATERPVVVSARERFERLSLDLRQVGDLGRFLVYAYSGDGSPLAWGGTLQLETYGGARVEMSIEHASFEGVFVLLSAYNVNGELVLRAEREACRGSIREMCRAYGYEQITWLDDRLPVR